MRYVITALLLVIFFPLYANPLSTNSFLSNLSSEDDCCEDDSEESDEDIIIMDEEGNDDEGVNN